MKCFTPIEALLFKLSVAESRFFFGEHQSYKSYQLIRMLISNIYSISFIYFVSMTLPKIQHFSPETWMVGVDDDISFWGEILGYVSSLGWYPLNFSACEVNVCLGIGSMYGFVSWLCLHA